MAREYGRQGLKISRKKTVYLRVNGDENSYGTYDIEIQKEDLEIVTAFAYPGSTWVWMEMFIPK